nr:zinc ribbon domain-containing protein [Candidatus Gracilibacteria bacterium]
MQSTSLDILFKNLYDSITFDVFIKIVIVYFFIIWISIIIWVLKDITNRTDSLILQLISLFIVIFLTPLGVFIYLIIRPGRTNLEKSYREIDDNLDLLSSIVKDKFDLCNLVSCPKCETKVDKSFRYCPNCSYELKMICTSCKRELMPEWKVCPYCSEKQEKSDKKDDKKKKK